MIGSVNIWNNDEETTLESQVYRGAPECRLCYANILLEQIR